MEPVFSNNIISYANLLLLVATLLYIAHLKFRQGGVGLWAMGLSATGALGLIGGLILKLIGQPPSYIPLTTLPDVLSLFSAITVLAYLIMEYCYRTRSAGAFVMPIVAVAILFQSFGTATTSGKESSQLLHSYWIHAHVLANLVAYSAFAAAAALGAMYSWRSFKHFFQEQTGGPILLRHNLSEIELLMHQSVKLGFVLYTLAQALGIYFADKTWGENWGWDPKELWTLFIWIWYAAYVVMQQSYRWHGRRMAWWAITGFVLTAVGSLAVNLFFSGLHFYG